MVYKSKKCFRLPGYDYSFDGYYYVTICTNKRQCVFGDILDGQMHLSPIGKIAESEWLKTPKIRENIKLDEWVIMPNHIHGIVILQHSGLLFRRHEAAPRAYNGKHPYFSKISPRPNSLSTIIGSFKSIVSKRCHCNGLSDFAWQTRFYDHIIRSEKSLNQIRQYIRHNLQKWHLDRHNPINLLTKAIKLVD